MAHTDDNLSADRTSDELASRRRAVVIGGASGLGRAIAVALAADGCRITVADRDLEAATAVAEALGDGHDAHPVDVTDEASVAALFDERDAPDIVVNSAGISTFGLITDLEVDQFRSVVDVNLTGGFLVLKHAGRRLVDGGALVSITSLNARQPAVGMSAYCSAKAGLVMLTQVGAMELGARGIRVNAVSPGFVPTPLTDPATAVPGVVDDYLANTPLGRVGTPEDVANAVVFLCSANASWMTGEVIDLNGGAHLMRYPDLHGHIMALTAPQ
ncbi:SDR family NAD(P)-dependent oxidoreductase [Williamsia phyllosphaerae]|uniref:Short-chain dehydrogenase n=1 Tax=Williamsia phyllosphaerae TaxID=885042 RepID=A0ABQ1V3L2_9NOCA|nr:SDR family NAD(P)-dependent oxidoreductase [Williamsia phyllosphaerae]GGF36640.1 short-chain dehydrogenase [Williamsia phyllosphaerae]